jgi:hypothetical protein
MKINVICTLRRILYCITYIYSEQIIYAEPQGTYIEKTCVLIFHYCKT